MKNLVLLLSLITFIPSISYAGRMPEQLKRVESAGAGYLRIYPVIEELEGEYHVVQSMDVKRLVGSNNAKECYMFYFTGIELVKLPIKNQSCEAALSELVRSIKG